MPYCRQPHHEITLLVGLRVEQVFGAQSSELFQRALPLVDDAARVLPCLNGLQDPASADQGEGFVKLENVRIQLPEGRCKFDPKFSRIKSLAVNQNDLDAVTEAVGKGTARGLKSTGTKRTPWISRAFK